MLQKVKCCTLPDRKLSPASFFSSTFFFHRNNLLIFRTNVDFTWIINNYKKKKSFIGSSTRPSNVILIFSHPALYWLADKPISAWVRKQIDVWSNTANIGCFSCLSLWQTCFELHKMSILCQQPPPTICQTAEWNIFRDQGLITFHWTLSSVGIKLFTLWRNVKKTRSSRPFLFSQLNCTVASTPYQGSFEITCNWVTMKLLLSNLSFLNTQTYWG